MIVGLFAGLPADSVEGMAPQDFDVLVTQIPKLAQRIWLDEIAGEPALNVLLAELKLPQIEYFDGTAYGSLELDFVELADQAAMERKLRAAISKLAGKAAGSEKYWDLGGYQLTLRMYEDSMRLTFHSQYSLPEYRAAARDWLDGADSMEWMVAHRLIDPAHAEQNGRGFFEKPEWGMSWPLARLHEGKARVTGSLNPSANPPGVRPASAAAGAARAIDYFSEVLGAPDDAERVARGAAQPVWTRGNRSFSCVGMGARARSLSFIER